MFTQDKLIGAKKLQKDWESYFGMYVALDEKDRLIAYGKDRKKVFEEAYDFFAFSKPINFRIYRIFDAYKRQLIKSLLDDTW